MFQRLNNMFVGELSNLPSQEPEFSEKEEEEWILVDFIDSCSSFSTVDEEEEEEVDNICKPPPDDHSPVFSCLPDSLDCLADASESCFIQLDSCPLEESWFITPPPCFTAGGLTTLKVETSPLENLLIEHPSMSVYAIHNICHNLNKHSCDEKEEQEEEEEEGEEEVESRDESNHRSEAQSKMGQHVQCYIAALAAHSTKSFRPSQWIKEFSERQSLNRNCLRRQNLTRDPYTRQLKNSGFFVHQPCQHTRLEFEDTKKRLSVWINTVYQPMRSQWQLVCGAIFLVSVAELLDDVLRLLPKEKLDTSVFVNATV